MKIYGLWWGGNSYSRPRLDDLEVFASIAGAKRAVVDRYMSNWILLQDFDYVERGRESVLSPCVTEESETWLFDAPDGDLSYPDRRVFLGPQGGPRIERC